MIELFKSFIEMYEFSKKIRYNPVTQSFSFPKIYEYFRDGNYLEIHNDNATISCTRNICEVYVLTENILIKKVKHNLISVEFTKNDLLCSFVCYPDGTFHSFWCDAKRDSLDMFSDNIYDFCDQDLVALKLAGVKL